MENLEDDPPDDFEVWPENWTSVMVFLSLQTQWRKEYAGMAGQLVWHGLRYGETEIAIRMMGLQERATSIFLDLVTMEMAALPLLNKSKR